MDWQAKTVLQPNAKHGHFVGVLPGRSLMKIKKYIPCIVKESSNVVLLDDNIC